MSASISGLYIHPRENASLTIMVGGDQETFDKVLPIFQLLGKNITLVGENGDGQTCKVANQIIVALTIEAVAEAMIFASKAGADQPLQYAGPRADDDCVLQGEGGV